MLSAIDIAFDFRSDAAGKDPDIFSPTLRQYHKKLWAKPLQSGVLFNLDDDGTFYLHHRSEAGEYFLSSDAVIPTFSRESRISHILEQVQPEKQETFNRIGYTIGGMMLFPGNRIGRKMTINGARGFHPRIKDRFDLTLECIRRHYRHETSPLSDTVGRYADFFGLFGDFRGYVNHFLLQDLVSADYSEVRFFAPFENFGNSPLPGNVAEYQSYRQLAMDFIGARNRRIFEDARAPNSDT